MATILVVDDNPVGRELLVQLLAYSGHTVLEARDGAEALTIVQARRPDLVIADVLMPTMDGYEFVRQVRAQPGVARTPVIFYTAAFQEQEARALAQRCGVRYMLSKPSDPEIILRAVATALELAAGQADRDSMSETAAFDREHLRLVSDRLVRSASELETLSRRLGAIVELGLELASEPDSHRLLQLACDAGRQLIRVRYGLLEVGGMGGNRTFVAGGFETGSEQRDNLLALLHQLAADGGAQLTGIARGLRYLATPLATPSQAYGCFILAGAADETDFSADDRQLARMLAAQLSIAYENVCRLEALREAVQARDDFLSIAAHELKTPVTAVRGYAQLLRARDSAKPVQLGSSERALAVIERQSLKLGRLIEQLLNVSRIATGKLQIYSQASDIPALVRTAIDGLHATGDTHVLVQHGPEHLIADVDPLRIEQVIVNLLDNAAKYSPPDSRIDVLLEPIGEMRFQLVVQDHGSGIPADKRSHIFDRFYQAHAELHGSGMGLGLYISRQIIELHGGCISAEFPADGGTRVVISLPTTNASRRDPSQILVAGAR